MEDFMSEETKLPGKFLQCKPKLDKPQLKKLLLRVLMNPNPDQRLDLNKEPIDRLIRIDHLSPGYEVVSINQPQFLAMHEPNHIRSSQSGSSYSAAMSPDCGRSLGYGIDPDMNCGPSLLLALPEVVLALVSGLLNPPKLLPQSGDIAQEYELLDRQLLISLDLVSDPKPDPIIPCRTGIPVLASPGLTDNGVGRVHGYVRGSRPVAMIVGDDLEIHDPAVLPPLQRRSKSSEGRRRSPDSFLFPPLIVARRRFTNIRDAYRANKKPRSKRGRANSALEN
ncbi:hypothetical protein EJ110_NYTH54893 [Nymphaea thermarum]|nr:hypothetical protein EJ110_NYTH54893 [Nymphaea thermarum]